MSKKAKTSTDNQATDNATKEVLTFETRQKVIMSEYNATMMTLTEKIARQHESFLRKVVARLHVAASKLPDENPKKRTNYGVKMARASLMLGQVHRNSSKELGNLFGGNLTKALEGLPAAQEIAAKTPERTPKKAPKKASAAEGEPKAPKAKRSPKHHKPRAKKEGLSVAQGGGACRAIHTTKTTSNCKYNLER